MSAEVLRKYHHTVKDELKWLKKNKEIIKKSLIKHRVVPNKFKDNLEHRRSKETPLASHFLIQDAFETILYKGRVPRSIGKVLAKELFPIGNFRPPEIVVEGVVADTKYMFCQDAEYYFDVVAKQVIGKNPVRQRRVSVYHNNDGDIIALRKNDNESSALSLSGISIEGLVIPPGIFLDIGSTIDIEKTGETRVGDPYSTPPWYVETYCVDGPLHVGLGRMSAWSHSDQSMSELFSVDAGWSTPEVSESRLAICKANNLDSMQRIAESVLNLAQTTE